MNTGTVISDAERMVDQAGVVEKPSGAPSAADLDKVAEETNVAAATAGSDPGDGPAGGSAVEESPEAVKVTTLECGLGEGEPELQVKCKEEAIAIINVSFFAQYLIKDLHVCAKHLEMVSKGALQLQKKDITRIVRPDGAGLIVPGR